MNQYQLPPDYEAEIDSLRKRQELMQALAMQQFQPRQTQMVSGIAVKQSPLAMGLRALSGVLAQRNAKAAQDEQKGVYSKFQQEGEQELQALQGLSPQEAIIKAMTARGMPARAYGAQLLAQQKADEELRREIGKIAGKDNPEGAVKYLQGKNTQAPIPPATPWEPVQAIPGVPGGYGQRDPRTGKTDWKFEPKATSVTVDTAGEIAATKALGGKVPEVLESARQGFIDAQQALQNAQQIEKLAGDPQTVTGFAAGPLGGLSAIGAKMGLTGPDAAAKTQVLLSSLAKQTLEASKTLKGAISDKEKPFLEQASAGALAYTPEALQHLARLTTAVSHNRMVQARQQWLGATSVPGAQAGAAMYPLPPWGTHGLDPKMFQEMPGDQVKYIGEVTPTSGTQKPLTLDEYLKKQGL